MYRDFSGERHYKLLMAYTELNTIEFFNAGYSYTKIQSENRFVNCKIKTPWLLINIKFVGFEVAIIQFYKASLFLYVFFLRCFYLCSK